MELQKQRAELALYADENEMRRASSSERESELRRRRSADPADSSLRKSGNGGAR
jgi:hypothetical protein